MTDERANEKSVTLTKRAQWIAKVTWLVVEHIFDITADMLEGYARSIRSELELFLGVAFAGIGLLNFENGKNCDGNIANYLTCTHPSTYYYYNWLEITLIVVGVILILLWCVGQRRQKK